MKDFPFLRLRHTLTVLRITVAILFMAHAGMRIANGTIPRFSEFLEGKGFLFGSVIVWAITLFELSGGLLMVLGLLTRWVAAGFLAIASMGIVLIHAQFGWFVGEHGTGGMEYSVALIVALLAIASADRPRERLRLA